MDKKRFYISVKGKFVLTILIILFWIVVCTFIEIPWFNSLQNSFGTAAAVVIVMLLAFFPGIMISLTLTGIILDRPKRREIITEDLEDITILVAAYNEESSIYDTLKSLHDQDYPKRVIIKVIDNNSKDNTKSEIFRAIKDFPETEIEYRFEKTQGKFAALNNGLASTDTRFVITIDADTYLYKDSIKHICNSMVQENKNKEVAAIAGTILVRNSRENLLTKMQEWEYFLSIASIKRTQGLFQAVLVAQGAFSIYDTEKVKAIGGWADSIGEDIVVTWSLLSSGDRTYYDDRAIAFTNAPTDLTVFLRQRARWARGMIEGFRHFSFKSCTNGYAKFFIFCDLFLFFIDSGISFVFIPGLISALLFHKFWIVGPMTLVLLPLTFILFLIMLRVENKQVFVPLGLKVRGHWGGLLSYMLLYSLLLSPVCIKGYIQEFTGTKRKWK